MKTKAPEKEVAACLPEQAAGKNLLPNKAYLNAESPSRLKLAIGQLLLFGNKQRQEFWEVFEALLVQFYQEGSQSACAGRDMAVGATNMGERVCE